jgi:hypothetical protein
MRSARGTVGVIHNSFYNDRSTPMRSNLPIGVEKQISGFNLSKKTLLSLNNLKITDKQIDSIFNSISRLKSVREL